MATRCPVLVERDDELRTLSRLASDGREGVVVITGEAGTGKSRLAQEFAASLPEPWTVATVTITRTRGALRTLPSARPLALILEDAHFLDPATLAAVGEPNVLTVLTFQLGVQPAGSAEVRALADLVARGFELRLLPLSPAGFEQMAAAMGRYAAADVYARSGGNPFWAEQLLASAGTVPWTVVEAVTRQLDVLPASARELACALAVADEALPPAVAAQLVEDVDAAWAALVDAGLVGEAMALRHALVGEALRARLGPEEQARWHGRLAAALDGPPDRVARHWAAAGEVERAAVIAREAAADLRAQGATRRAFECFEIALRRPQPAELYEEAAVNAARIGELAAMRRWLVAAERAYIAAGRRDRAVRMRLDPAFDYRHVRRSAAIRDEPVERLLVDAQAAMATGERASASHLVAAAVETARERRDGMALARAARMTLLTLGEFERGDALLEEALAFDDVRADPGRESRVLTIRAVARFAQGHALECLDLQRRAVAIGGHDADAVRRPGQVALANTLLMTGQIGEGVDTMKAALGEEPSMLAIVDGYREFEQGDAEGGLAMLAAGTDAMLTEFDFDPLGRAVTGAHVLNVRAVCEAHAGRAAAALRTVRRLDALAPEPFSDVAADSAYVLARAGAAAGDDEAKALARRRIADLVRVASGPGVMAAAEAVQAFTAPGADVTRHFQAAAALYERAPRVVLAAELWCDAGCAARARRVCEEHGLARVGARAAALPGRRPGALAPLTSREREVVELAAGGLTNREIGARLYLSDGTVRNYLSTAFAKLGVSRRAELGRLLPD
ncbi:helix-turn-helix transcriptional regulator [Solirubrobacter soli]|uniref:helix-turn-helix transcriptional regulator n=1 Tax=Solirubrobacter soli TaxID=363832 RepID=UPI0004878708|nr:LuxR C-terminal-related transcriptional regulator [Solirubrobacter soli]